MQKVLYHIIKRKSRPYNYKQIILSYRFRAVCF